MDKLAYSFVVEWYDYMGRRFVDLKLNFYPDKGIELFIIKDNLPFLKKTRFPNLELNDFYIGRTLNLLGRQITVLDFGDDHTRGLLEDAREHALLFLWDQPAPISALASLLDQGVELGKIKSFTMDSLEALSSGSQIDRKGSRDSEGLVCHLTWPKASSSSSFEPSIPLPSSSSYTLSYVQANEIRALLRSLVCPTPFSSSSLCLVKPHLSEDARNLSRLLESIGGQFEVGAVESFHLSSVEACEFFDVYRGVFPDYSDMLDHLSSGQLIAIEIRGLLMQYDTRGTSESVVEAFREFCGPIDPEVARILRPESLRAQFGESRTRNAIHCTDLPEDGGIETSYFFNTLSNL